HVTGVQTCALPISLSYTAFISPFTSNCLSDTASASVKPTATLPCWLVLSVLAVASLVVFWIFQGSVGISTKLEASCQESREPELPSVVNTWFAVPLFSGNV